MSSLLCCITLPCQHAVSTFWKASHGYQLETELDKQQFCLELTSIQTDRQARLHSFAALSCVRLSDECACLPAALSSAHTYSTPQLGSYWFPVLRHTVCMHTIDAVSSFLHMSYHQQGWLTSFSQYMQCKDCSHHVVSPMQSRNGSRPVVSHMQCRNGSHCSPRACLGSLEACFSRALVI